MSEATSVTAQALYNHTGSGYDMSNRCVLRRDRKTATEGAEVTCSGSNKGATEIAGLDIGGLVWQGWTMTDDLRTGVIWLVIDVVDQ